MSAEDLDSALAATDSEASRRRLSQLIEPSVAFTGQSLPSTAVQYLIAFCDPTVPAEKRRWVGLVLSKLIRTSHGVPQNLRANKKQVSQLGQILLASGELEETRIIAGLVIREALCQGIAIAECWPSSKVPDSAPIFPQEDGTSWMKDFQQYMDILEELKLASEPAGSSPDLAILYPVSVSTSDGFRWPDADAASPVALIQNRKLTLLATDLSLQQFHFVDISLNDIAEYKLKKASLHGSQAEMTDHEPWDVEIDLDAGFWTYHMNELPQAGIRISILFQHKADAAECHTCIKEILSLPKAKSTKSKSPNTASLGLREPTRNTESMIRQSNHGRGSLPVIKKAAHMNARANLREDPDDEYAVPEDSPNGKNASGRLQKPSNAAIKTRGNPSTKANGVNGRQGVAKVRGERSRKIEGNDRGASPCGSDTSSKHAVRDLQAVGSATNTLPKVTKQGSKRGSRRNELEEDEIFDIPNPRKRQRAVHSTHSSTSESPKSSDNDGSDQEYVAPRPARKKARHAVKTSASQTSNAAKTRSNPNKKARRGKTSKADDVTHISPVKSSPVAPLSKENPAPSSAKSTRPLDSSNDGLASKRDAMEPQAPPSLLKEKKVTQTLYRLVEEEEAPDESPLSRRTTASTSNPVPEPVAGSEGASEGLQAVDFECPEPSTTAQRKRSMSISSSPKTPKAKRVRTDGFEDLPKTMAPPRLLSEAVSPTLDIKAISNRESGDRAAGEPVVNGSSNGRVAVPIQSTPPRGNTGPRSLPTYEPQGKETPANRVISRTFSSGSGLEICSSNSKPLPAPPTAASTAISGHASHADLDEEEQRGRRVHAEDPFKHSSGDRRLNSFHRRLEEIVGIELPTPTKMAPPSMPIGMSLAGNRNTNLTAFDMDGDETLIGQEDDEPALPASPVHIPSSPPGPRARRSPSSHSSTSAEPEDDDELEAEIKELEEWEASLRPHQRTLNDQLTRITRRVLRHIVDKEEAVHDVAEAFRCDGERLIQDVTARHAEEHGVVLQEVRRKKEDMKRELEGRARKLRERVRSMEGVVLDG